MNQRRTMAIVLTRVDYGEADRILTVLTATEGKLSLIAKGVRKIKSKMAGGIELFSLCELTYIPPKSSLGTLVSARLVRHFGMITRRLERTMLGYELIGLLHKVTEEVAEPAYYDLLEQTFFVLDDHTVSVEFIRLWFYAHLLRLAGHTPNLLRDVTGDKLVAEGRYRFDYDAVAFCVDTDGAFGVDEIKFLRLLFGVQTAQSATAIAKITGAERLTSAVSPLVITLRQLYLRS